MLHDFGLYVLLPFWVACCIGCAYDAWRYVKKPVHRANGTQATRNTTERNTTN